MSNSFVTPIDCSLPGSSVQGISQARKLKLKWVAISSFWDLPDPGMETTSPVLAGRFFTTEPPGKFDHFDTCMKIITRIKLLYALKIKVNIELMPIGIHQCMISLIKEQLGHSKWSLNASQITEQMHYLSLVAKLKYL